MAMPQTSDEFFCSAKNRFQDKLANSLGCDNAKRRSLQGLRPLTRGSAPGPLRGTAVIGSRSPCGRQTLTLDAPVINVKLKLYYCQWS